MRTATMISSIQFQPQSTPYTHTHTYSIIERVNHATTESRLTQREAGGGSC